MSDKIAELTSQLEQIKNGLFRMGPDRIRAMSTHETDDLLIELSKVADAALANVASMKSK